MPKKIMRTQTIPSKGLLSKIASDSLIAITSIHSMKGGDEMEIVISLLTIGKEILVMVITNPLILVFVILGIIAGRIKRRA